jgi:hypothetical protein
MTMKTIKEIVKEYLVANGFDGLVHVDTKCGCGIDDLFCVAECPDASCQAAHRVRCKRCGIELYSTEPGDCDSCCFCMD